MCSQLETTSIILEQSQEFNYSLYSVFVDLTAWWPRLCRGHCLIVQEPPKNAGQTSKGWKGAAETRLPIKTLGSGIDRDVLWQSMRHYGIPEQYITIIQNKYTAWQSKIINEGPLTEANFVMTGLSPFTWYSSSRWTRSRSHRQSK